MEVWHFQTVRGKKLKTEKTAIQVLYNYFERSTLLVYNYSKYNFLRHIIIILLYSKCVLLNNVLKACLYAQKNQNDYVHDISPQNALMQKSYPLT